MTKDGDAEDTPAEPPLDNEGEGTSLHTDEFDEIWDELKYEHGRVQNQFHKGMIMHSLAAEYYGVRAYWLSFLPLLIVTTFYTFVGFFIPMAQDSANGVTDTTNGATNTTDADGFGISFADVKNTYAYVKNADGSLNGLHLFQGLLGLFSTFLTALSKYFNYQSQADAHRNAAQAFKDVWEREITQLHNDRKFHGWDIKSRYGLNTGKRMTTNRKGCLEEIRKSRSDSALKQFHDLFESIEKGCTGSRIPPRIRLTFDTIEKNFNLTDIEGAFSYMDYRGNVKGWEWNNIIQSFYLKLWRRFYEWPTLFPWYIPLFSLKAIQQEIIEERDTREAESKRRRPEKHPFLFEDECKEEMNQEDL